MAPSISVNEEADPPTITVGINGKTAQANLPEGGEGWEEIDMSNFPTDFEVGERILVILKFSVSFSGMPTDWNTTPTTGTISFNPGFTTQPYYLEMAIADGYGASKQYTISISNQSQTVTIQTLQIKGSSVWNNPDGSASIFTITAMAINGAGKLYDTFIISKSQAPNYFSAMYRKKGV